MPEEIAKKINKGLGKVPNGLTAQSTVKTYAELGRLRVERLGRYLEMAPDGMSTWPAHRCLLTNVE